MKCAKCSSGKNTVEPAALVVCSGCGTQNIYHEQCWSSLEEHRRKPHSNVNDDDTDEDGEDKDEGHEKTEMQDYIWIKYLLNPKIQPGELETLHRKDVWTKWFGVPPNVPKDATMPQLISYHRVESLLSMHSSRRCSSSIHPTAPKSTTTTLPSTSAATPNSSPDFDSTNAKVASGSLVEISARQYPSLVSFFGETGGGKSTLIRALIRSAAPGTTSFQTPVSAAKGHINISTSGDVHLYADPQTISTQYPMMYAGM
jgi:hypothetical protein